MRVVWAGVAVLAALPFALPSPAVLNFAILTATAAALGQGWNLAGGFGGLMSFGHALFFGIGAYTAAILQSRWGVSPWLGVPAAAALGGLTGFVVGMASFRAGLRGSYFALVTLAFAEACRVLANSVEFTRGGLGILLPFRAGLDTMQFTDRRVPYAIALVLLAIGTLAAIWLRRSRFGAQLAAVREGEDAARALGIDPVATKSRALALSGAVTAMGGVLYVQSYLYIDPGIAFGVERSVEALLVAMVGGAGTVLGPLLGALVLHTIESLSRLLTDTPGFAPMLYGVVLLAVVGLLPGGIARRLRA